MSMNRRESIAQTMGKFSYRNSIMMSYLDKKYPKNDRTPELELAIATAYNELCEDKESGIAHLTSIKLFCSKQQMLSECQLKADEIIPKILAQLKNQIGK